jgi:hypothetical protein
MVVLPFPSHSSPSASRRLSRQLICEMGKWTLTAQRAGAELLADVASTARRPVITTLDGRVNYDVVARLFRHLPHRAQMAQVRLARAISSQAAARPQPSRETAFAVAAASAATRPTHSVRDR